MELDAFPPKCVEVAVRCAGSRPDALQLCIEVFHELRPQDRQSERAFAHAILAKYHSRTKSRVYDALSSVFGEEAIPAVDELVPLAALREKITPHLQQLDLPSRTLAALYLSGIRWTVVRKLFDSSFTALAALQPPQNLSEVNEWLTRWRIALTQALARYVKEEARSKEEQRVKEEGVSWATELLQYQAHDPSLDWASWKKLNSLVALTP